MRQTVTQMSKKKREREIYRQIDNREVNARERCACIHREFMTSIDINEVGEHFSHRYETIIVYRSINSRSSWSLY